MAEQNTETATTDVESTYTSPGNDPKNMQEVTQYVSFPFHEVTLSWLFIFYEPRFYTSQ